MNVLITGSSRGIGRELVEEHLSKLEVEKVFAVTRHPDAFKTLEQKYSGRLIPLGASVSEDSSKAVITDALKGVVLDLLINNAGTYVEEPDDFPEIPIEVLQKSLEVNAFAAFRTTQACLPALKRSKNPKVVHISSLMGSISDNTSGGAYGYRISKVALNMFNKCFSIEYPEIIAVVMHPGWVKTEMGGAQALLSVKSSVSGIIRQIEKIRKSESGNFIDYEGETLPW